MDDFNDFEGEFQPEEEYAAPKTSAAFVQTPSHTILAQSKRRPACHHAIRFG